MSGNIPVLFMYWEIESKYVYLYLFIIQILPFQEPAQRNIEPSATLSIPSLDSEIISNSSQGDVQTRKNSGLPEKIFLSFVKYN